MTECIHHEIIEAPRGQGKLRGICRKCGRVKYYVAGSEYLPWEETGRSQYLANKSTPEAIYIPYTK